MDLIDKKILCELDENCRIPISRLAKNLRISRNVASYRIKNLEEKGIVRKYIASINLGLLGFRTYKIYFKIHTGKESEKEFVKSIISNKRIVSFLKLEGTFDYSVAIAVKNILELDDFLVHLNSTYKDLIKDYFVSIIVYSKIFKLSKHILDKKESIPKMEKYSGEEKKIDIESKDKKILKVLSQEANLPTVEIAQKTDLSVDIVKYRINKLSSTLVNSYRIIIGLDKLGFYHYVIMLRLRQSSKKDEEKLVYWCSQKKNVMYCTKRIGYFDFEINAAIKSIKEQLRAMPRKGSGYGVLRYLSGTGTDGTLNALPTPQVCFNYLGQFNLVTGPLLNRYVGTRLYSNIKRTCRCGDIKGYLVLLS